MECLEAPRQRRGGCVWMIVVDLLLAPPASAVLRPHYPPTHLRGRSASARHCLIPTGADQNLWAQSRMPMDMIFQGCSPSLVQASQQ
jgi:hypothetical protein